MSKVFVELADTMVAEFDVLELLQTLAERSVDLLDVDAAGLMLIDQRGHLQVMASTSDQVRLLALLELQDSEGPGFDCFTSGQPVVNIDLKEVEARWPEFAAVSAGVGFRTVHALPLRLRNQVIGAMNLFCAHRSTLGADDVALGQALADVATIGLLQERAVRREEMLAEQLQSALHGRILVEQAKGVLAERAGVDVDDAFRRMRAYGRSKHRPLSGVASAVIEGDVSTQELQRAAREHLPSST